MLNQYLGQGLGIPNLHPHEELSQDLDQGLGPDPDLDLDQGFEPDPDHVPVPGPDQGLEVTAGLRLQILETPFL